MKYYDKGTMLEFPLKVIITEEPHTRYSETCIRYDKQYQSHGYMLINKSKTQIMSNSTKDNTGAQDLYFLSAARTHHRLSQPNMVWPLLVNLSKFNSISYDSIILWNKVIKDTIKNIPKPPINYLNPQDIN